ncbi:MAG: SRPBCC family protein [Pseudohongiellaceae bacterium]|nr:SRPBCC family protein [Pseudohongiellaceae bacterium]
MLNRWVVGFLLQALLALPLILLSNAVFAEPEYATVDMEIDVDKPAAEVWEKVGDYCHIADWLNIDCTITSGDGGIGTVRVLAGGRVIEVLTAITPLSYGYTQPAVEGQFYNLYHGFLEARPTGENSTKLIYTLMLDVSNLADQAAKDADLNRRRGMFEAALGRMKAIAEE